MFSGQNKKSEIYESLKKTLMRVIKLNDIKIILRVHIKVRLYIQSPRRKEISYAW